MATDGPRKRQVVGGVKASIGLSWIAQKAHQRSKSNGPGEMDAIVAVVFWAMFQEAFINEQIFSAICSVNNTSLAEVNYGKEVCEFASWGEPVLEKYTPTTEKYQNARRIFTGGPYAEEEPPFKDSQSLVALRNGLVHMTVEKIYQDDSGKLAPQTLSAIKGKPDGEEKFTKRWLTAIEWLEKSEVIERRSHDAPRQSDFSHINTPAVAKWAGQTVYKIVQEFCESIGNPDARRLFGADHWKCLFNE